MCSVRPFKLGRGAIPHSLILSASMIAAMLSAAIINHKAIASHQIHPIDPTCTSSSPCIEYQNNGSGQGILGLSLLGNGVGGQTKFSSTSSSNGKAGVAGTDISTSGTFNSGVVGSSTRGTGVTGSSSSGNGVHGVSTSGLGVLGASSGGAGVRGVSTNGVGVQGTSSFFPGVNASGGDLTNCTPEFGCSDSYPALSVVGSTASEMGAVPDIIDGCEGTPSVCDLVHAVFSVTSAGGVVAPQFSDALGEVSLSNSCACFSTITAVDSLSVGTFSSPSTGDIFVTGDVDINGEYQKSGTCVAGCSAATTRSAGRAVGSYSAQETSPTIEDFGEAQLINGRAYVFLGADFANVIDQKTGYLVFITPDGPNRGLYVTQKTTRGFAVRENPGAQSTLSFDYRIVAKRYGATSARLPIVDVPRIRPHFGMRPAPTKPIIPVR